MKKALLVEFFDLHRWHFEMLFALFKVKPVWQLNELLDAFMATCRYVKSPPGSASMLEENLNAWLGRGYATLDKEKNIITAGISSNGKPVFEIDLGGALVPLIKAALEVENREKQRQKKLDDLAARYTRGEITPPEFLREHTALKNEFPRGK